MIYNLPAEYLISTVNYGPFYPSEADGWERGTTEGNDFLN